LPIRRITGVDLRPAAVHQHAAHADRAQQQQILRQSAVERLSFARVDRGAAEFYDDRLAREPPDVGQGAHQHVRDRLGAVGRRLCPAFIPANAGSHGHGSLRKRRRSWAPACAGVTGRVIMMLRCFP
jgi:hypothetical protein